MKLTWYGHSCFKLETAEGSIVFDPSENGRVPGYSHLPADFSADEVVCSHGHGDHNAAELVKLSGKGFGGKATELVLDCMRKDGKYEKVVLCYIDGNDAARHLYEKYGFVETDRDDDEIILMKELI